MMAVLLMLLFGWATMGFADGTVAQTKENYPDAGVRMVIFTCTGDASDGSIPDTDTNAVMTSFIEGYRLYQVDTYPTSGGTAPDAADVCILDENGLDLLGSVDGGTTAYGGLNLIHATLARRAVPDLFIPRNSEHAWYQPLVTGTLTLTVSNQDTAKANYTVVLSFTK